MYIAIALLISLLAVILDWQKDKSSFLEALKSNWLKYVVMFGVGAFLFGKLLDLPQARYIFSGLTCAGVYFAWSLVVNVFKKKPPIT